MKFIYTLLNEIILPVIVIIVTPFAIAFSSKISTGDWLKWFSSIPKWFSIIFIILVLLWYVIIIIRKRLIRTRELDSGLPVAFARIPIFGWVTIGKLEYSGLVWRIRIPTSAPWEDFDKNSIVLNSIEIEKPPRCPKCETEIEESHSFWGKYIWTCVRCNFKKTNKRNYNREGERAEKVARRLWEEQELK